MVCVIQYLKRQWDVRCTIEDSIPDSVKGLYTLVLVKKIEKFFIAFSESTYVAIVLLMRKIFVKG